MKTEITTLENKMVEIKGEIPSDIFAAYYDKAITRIGGHVEIDGFRKGKAPASAIEAKVGEEEVLREMAEMAISESYPKILKDENIDAIGQPLVSLTKLAKGNPLGFSIKTTVMPEINLPDYKKIAKGESAPEESDVTSKEVDDALLQVRKARAHQDSHKNGVDHEDHNPENIKESDLPELTDDQAKSFGPFDSIKTLKEAIKENISGDKNRQAREKVRVTILEKIIEETKADIPDLLIEIETENMLSRLTHDLEKMGSKMEDYLKNVNKTEAELRKEWREEAAKRAKLQLVIEKVAVEEGIEADKEMVDAEIKKVKEAYPETNESQVRQYVEVNFRNEKVFEFLEKLS
ncbi:MAG: FKBP-type peptidyl-prolyl cis-trans isomerase (trigger factor) [Candidatus Paceibacteria bacterium]|jgi:FKBP-type peptidyl-prolyl cis-trans isomerase (trigger factor)